ncbi:MAG: signal transduction protein [Desulfobulbaceae bacterium S3730MH12]|nr:MAG: signal transduction protein [Desulfobulbaceae bacterium S5133MH15]OEU57541.1 MAG: signal transduction protein [Desulfobulbaceae bacterium S3730MH12]OEU79948.1 MAG: signal transduction protein [Desulfobulbaceae bacterium C00003063]
MKTTAADIMTTNFSTLLPQTPVIDAIRIFQGSFNKQGRRLFGMIVSDEEQHLVGMLSMYDILLYLRPKHIHVWGSMEDLEIAGVIDAAGSRIKSILVGDIMTPDVVTVGPNANLMMVLDTMIKKHVRRLPVVEEQRIIGIVYISDLFSQLLERISD